MADPVGGLTVLKFLELLEAVKLLSPEELGALRKGALPAQEASDAGTLARMLVQQGKLTKHQAAALYQNKPKVVVLGQYVLLDRLGAGGMGTVYRGRHRQTQQVVAVKVLNAAAIRSADSVRRFQREAETVARLNHPNLVRALEADEVEGQHVFVMEFVEGIDLSSFVKKNGPLPLGEAVHCITQVARALAYAHEQGIVHRDIKPANLMLGSDGRIKVLDMGLARFNDPATTASGAADEGLTQTGQVMGTVDYMAPEQALHTRLADARADVYSLGCTFYKIVTGANPFDGDSLVAKILAHREQPIPSLKAFQSSIPRATDLVLQKMLAKSPDQRYQSMAALADELERSLTITDSQADQRTMPAAVPVAKVAAARADAASTSFTLNIKTEGASASSTSSPGEPPVWCKPGRSKKPVLAAIALLLVAGGAGLWVMKDQLFPGPEELEIVRLVPAEASANEYSSTAIPAATPSNTTRTAITFTGLPITTVPPPVVAINSTTNPPSSITSTTAGTPVTTTSASVTTVTNSIPSSTTNVTTSTGSVASSPANPTTGVPESSTQTPPASTDTAKSEPPTEPADVRAEIPTTTEQDAALKLIRGELYKDDFAKAKKLDERQALGKMLFERGMALEGDDAGRYVMLREARELAAETGDTETVDAVAARIAASYKVESLPWLLDGYEPALKKTLMGTTAKQIAENLLTKVDPLIVDDQFDLAERLLTAVQAAARKSQDGATLKAATERAKKFEKEKQQWEALARAKKALEANPDDPAANLVLGRRLCFDEGEWSAGFECLAKGSDPALKELAAASLLAPTETDAIVATADQWWAKADKTTVTAAKREFQAGAIYWYEQAASKATGLMKTKIDKRIADGRAAGAGVASRSSGKGTYLVVPLSPTVNLALRLIPAGSFDMGSPTTEPGRSPEEVRHRVTITRPFFLAVTEMTQEQWNIVMQGTYRSFNDDPLWPVDNVSHYGMGTLISRLNTGPSASFLRFRLPTEAEWEYAARAGSTKAYSWGDDVESTAKYAVANASTLSRVATKLPNAWGLYDMLGNVSEACEDVYSASTYGPNAVFDPKVPAATMIGGSTGSSLRVHRGGTRYSNPTQLRCAARANRNHGSPMSGVGLRLACDVLGEVPAAMFRTDVSFIASASAAAPRTAPVGPTISTPPSVGTTSPPAVPGQPVAPPPADSKSLAESMQAFANWVFQRGGSVLYRKSGSLSPYGTSNPATLASAGPITIRGASFSSSSANAPLTADDFKYLGSLSWLKELAFYNGRFNDEDVALMTVNRVLERFASYTNSRLTDASLKSLAALPNLQYLTFSGSSATFAVDLGNTPFAGLKELNLQLSQVNDEGATNLARLTQLTKLDIQDSQITDAGLAKLRGLTRLMDVNLARTKISDAGLAVLSGWPALERLSLQGCAAITGSGLSALASCPRLGDLNLAGTAVTDAALASLRKVPSLRTVDLSSCRISSKALTHFEGFPHLSSLRLASSGVGDDDLETLARLPSLSTIYLNDTAVGDVGAAKLAFCPRLSSVHLMRCRGITDKAAASLAKYPSMRYLHINGSQMTAAGMQAIKAANPQITIYNSLGIQP